MDPSFDIISRGFPALGGGNSHRTSSSKMRAQHYDGEARPSDNDPFAAASAPKKVKAIVLKKKPAAVQEEEEDGEEDEMLIITPDQRRKEFVIDDDADWGTAPEHDDTVPDIVAPRPKERTRKKPVKRLQKKAKKTDFGGDDDDGEGVSAGNTLYFNKFKRDADDILGEEDDDPEHCICRLNREHGTNYVLAEGMKSVALMVASKRNNSTHITRALDLAEFYERYLREPYNNDIQQQLDAMTDQKDKDALLKEKPLLFPLSKKQAWWHEISHRKDQETKQLIAMEMIGYVRDGVMGKMWTEDEETGEESINLEMMEPFKAVIAMEAGMLKTQFKNNVFAGSAAESMITMEGMSSLFPMEARCNTYFSKRGSLLEFGDK